MDGSGQELYLPHLESLHKEMLEIEEESRTILIDVFFLEEYLSIMFELEEGGEEEKTRDSP
jgi:hypothetical protein